MPALRKQSIFSKERLITQAISPQELNQQTLIIRRQEQRICFPKSLKQLPQNYEPSNSSAETASILQHRMQSHPRKGKFHRNSLSLKAFSEEEKHWEFFVVQRNRNSSPQSSTFLRRYTSKGEQLTMNASTQEFWATSAQNGLRHLNQSSTLVWISEICYPSKRNKMSRDAMLQFSFVSQTPSILEIVKDMAKRVSIAGLKRFIGRRDIGTNFTRSR